MPTTGRVWRAWDDSRACYAAVDPTVVRAPDPDDAGVAEWLMEWLRAASEDPTGLFGWETWREAVEVVVARLARAAEVGARELLRDLGPPAGGHRGGGCPVSAGRDGVGRGLGAAVEEWRGVEAHTWSS